MISFLIQMFVWCSFMCKHYSLHGEDARNEQQTGMPSLGNTYFLCIHLLPLHPFPYWALLLLYCR